MTRLLADENFPFPVVEILRQLRHDVLTFYETGKAGQKVSDEDVLAMAVAGSRAPLTLNRKHFIHLHTAKPDHAGIIVCTFDPNYAGQAQRIDSAVLAQTELSGQLIGINRPSQ